MPCKNCPHAEGGHNEQGCTTCAICGSRGMTCGHMDAQPDAVCRCGGYEEGGDDPPCIRCEEPCRATDHYEDPAGNPLCDVCAELPEYIKCRCGHVESDHKDGQCTGKTPDGKPACACTKFREAF